MSAKWVRAKQWDDRHLTGALSPAKWVLRALSSIPLAVVLLILVAVYGILASVPIGIVAMAPTWAFYLFTLLVAIAIAGVLPAWGLGRVLKRQGVSSAVRWGVGVVATVALTIGAIGLWYRLAWPVLKYDAATGRGVEFFSDFVERYKAVQLRRLPHVEMSEMEFYAWWPLQWILLLFVVNLVVATIRRIEFSVPRIGVLMVHTGIVVIALGSVYYTANKQEGDMLLMAPGALGQGGGETIGRPETGFYDNTAVALWVTSDPSQGWEQRRLEGVPRYNDYNLQAVEGAETPDWGTGVQNHRDYGPINVQVPEGPGASGQAGTVSGDVRFRVVGYMSFGELESKWVSSAKEGDGSASRSLRKVEAILDMTGSGGAEGAGPQKVWTFVPELPAARIAGLDLLEIEYTRGMDERRWADLQATLPTGSQHALVVDVPGKDGGAGHRAAYSVNQGDRLAIGDTGYTLEVKSLLDRPPFPIITKGYEGAASSVAIVRIARPGDLGASERWVYHRFPEISQDLSDELNERGMARRTPASADIRITYVDASRLQVYLDERASGDVRAMVRMPGGQVVVTPMLKEGASLQVAPRLSLRLGERAEHAVKVEVPRVTPPAMRQKDLVGNHKAAAIAVEVSVEGGGKSVHWLPFAQYLRAGQDESREVELGGGRRVVMSFSRVRHEFSPAMAIALRDFEMIPYPHSQTPRDYRSEVAVLSNWNGRAKREDHATSLNAPLLVRTPFVKRDDAPAWANAAGWAMSVIAPNQYKFSQAGWDATGWQESRRLVESGQAAKAFARFTILGVGNNPGIYIIATGAVLMSVGIPWAFYLKPWLIQRQKRTLQAAVARGEFSKARPSRNGTQGMHDEAGRTSGGVEHAEKQASAAEVER